MGWRGSIVISKWMAHNDKYCLQIGGGEGPPGVNDAMAYHNGEQVMTHDSDNDLNNGNNCASRHTAGWWFSQNCVDIGALLTGLHLNGYHWSRLNWYLEQGGQEGLKNYHNVEMKIHSKSYSGINNCYSKPRKSTKLNYEGDVYQSD